jgi:hypothetical protein
MSETMSTFADLMDAYNKVTHEYQRALNEKVLAIASPTGTPEALLVIAKAHLYRDDPDLVARWEAAHDAFEVKAAEIRERETEAMEVVKASHQAMMDSQERYEREREEWKREKV